ncbi:hypothetical protein HFP57_05830 [Parasphingopyxis algicola]|uniref:tetratricopeptide repeat protein n=1 Tax=Parasphingopyxis algicola TaxID=2026624 RepID=UPI0015A2EE51|nr:tetratricopeptide repeat protein [Parasphingopyxis algicola]QLC24593.1 hypothetical protein HFP57_05830 [Parasphingopyxis algicola]
MRFLIFIAATLLIVAPADARWRRGESTNFIVYAEFSESRMREYVAELERFDGLLRRFSGLETVQSLNKLRIFVVRNQGRISRYLDGNMRVGGIYFSDPRGPYAIVPRRSAGYGRFRVTGQNVLFHEYTHHFMMQYFPTSYPAWYVEGFAEFYSTIRFRDDDEVELGFPARDNVPWLRLFPWIPHETLLSNRLRNNRMTYAQGWLLVHHAAFHRETREALNGYLRAISDGIEPSEAYSRNFGDWDPGLDEILTAYGTGRRIPVLRLVLDLPPSGPVEIEELTDDEAAIALLYAREGEQLNDRVEDLLEEYPDVPQLHVEAAISAIARQDYTTAIEAADTALAIDADHVEANIYKGVATLLSITAQASDDDTATAESEDTGEESADGAEFDVTAFFGFDAGEELAADPRWEQARGHFIRANNADHNNALALLYYYLSYPDREDRPDDAMAALNQAYQFVPQSPIIRLLLGREMLEDGRFEEAGAIVRPVAQDPHQSGSRIMALLIQELGAREAGFDQASAILEELRAEAEAAEAADAEAESQVAAAAEEEAPEVGDETDTVDDPVAGAVDSPATENDPER